MVENLPISPLEALQSRKENVEADTDMEDLLTMIRVETELEDEEVENLAKKYREEGYVEIEDGEVLSVRVKQLRREQGYIPDSELPENSELIRESEWFLAWVEKPYKQGESTRGNLRCETKNDESNPYLENDVKISKQNLKSFVNDIIEAEERTEEEKDELYQQFLQLKYPAEEAALSESSDAEHQEKTEDLNVEEEEIEKVLQPSYIVALAQKTDRIHQGDYILKTVAGISALSKVLTDRPINLWSIGSSGAGKTHCFKTVFKTVPKELKIQFDSCSPKALYYFVRKYGEDSLADKVVFFNEAEASEDATEVLRNITDPDKEESTLSTVLDQKYMEVTIRGSPVTWFTSVDVIENANELQNRFLFSNPDEGAEHKERVAQHQKEQARRGTLQAMKEYSFEELKAAFRNIAENAADKQVIIPYDYEWNRIENPRLQTYFLNLLYTVTKIHYRDRLEVDGYLLASLDDYYFTKYIWNKIEEKTVDRLNNRDLKVLEEIPHRPRGSGDKVEVAVNRNHLQAETGFNYSKVRHSTEKLMDRGLIKGQKDGRQWEFYRIHEDDAIPAIQLKEGSLSVDSVKSFLEEELEIAQNGGVNEGEVSDKVLDLTPSFWKQIHAIFEKKSNESIEIMEREEDVLDGVPISAAGKNQENSSKPALSADNIRSVIEEKADGQDEAVEIQQIVDGIDAPEDKIEDRLNQLSSEGELFEPKPGRVQLL